MRLGFSFWGFIGPGITDTPDGGRSWRKTLLNGLATKFQLTLLQENRDLTEAADDLTGQFSWDAGLPNIDALFLEWRWPLPGRNTTACGSPGHTCDLHRQQELLDHYTHKLGVPTLIWDLDRTLAPNDPLRRHPAVQILDVAQHPADGARTLLVPVADQALDRADPRELVAGERIWPLVYVGNQYGRDAAFDRYFAPAARIHLHQVVGKWTHTEAWPHVHFAGRKGFPESQRVHRQALTTVLLAPERYARTGAISQRLFEAVLAGCLPFGPTEIRSIDRFVPSALLVSTSDDVTRRVADLRVSSLDYKAELLHDCIRRLDPYRASKQVATVVDCLETAL
ncbi:hypothetical protein GCM10010193_57290 [Kitasatospora atroaurantiaca]|uniref:Glycosyl transferase family 1 n=1 Tax=Kitasatospora atroaurantiaca TaxID=285545 RepID=A0A561EMZ5_9ACTN|nr:hypothetical protein [Kitasatospora atroaurantiaca]TWE16977.1 hypothetical protein FB465_1972 [Kitasatospora atroaurantiaca]